MTICQHQGRTPSHGEYRRCAAERTSFCRSPWSSGVGSTLCSVIVLLVVFVVAWASSAEAQFLKTDLRTFQRPDPASEFVSISSRKGLFVLRRHREGSLALFDLNTVKASDSTSFFIAYRPGTRIPQSLVLPGMENEYRIRGSFSITLEGGIRISITMNPEAAPVISLYSTLQGYEGVLVYVAGQVVANLEGAAVVKTLENDPLRKRFAKLLPDYSIAENNQLRLGSQNVPMGALIGLYSDLQHPCFAPNSRIYGWEAVKSLDARSTTSTAFRADLKRLKRSLSSAYLFLSVVGPEGSQSVGTRLFGIELSSGDVVHIWQDRFHEKLVCVEAKLQAGPDSVVPSSVALSSAALSSETPSSEKSRALRD